MQILENIPIPNFVANPEWGNRWNVGKNQEVSAYLDEAGNLCLKKAAKFTLHSVLNATARDLNQLPKGSGVSVDQKMSYTVSLNAASRDGVRAQLVIHEFDDSGGRLNRAAVKNSDRALYVPSPGTASLAISVRTTGQGTVTIRGLEFNPARGTESKPGLHPQGKFVETGTTLESHHRSPGTLLLTLRKALYDRTPLSVLLRRDEAPGVVSRLISSGYMLEAKAVVQQLDLYQEMTTAQLRKLYWHGRRAGYLLHALAALDEVIARTALDKDISTREALHSEYELHREPWGLLEPLPSAKSYNPSGPVVHMVGKALPERQTGYTVRTRYTTEALRSAGIECIIAVQSGGNHEEGLEEELEHTVAGVPTKLFAGPAKKDVLRGEWMQRNADELYKLVKRVEPSVIHAHSDFINGVLATHVGEATGVPVVYESRGFWEETWLSRISKVQNWENANVVLKLYGPPELYDLRRESERRVRERADRVITLSQTMKNFILEESPNGTIDPAHILIATNAVDPRAFPIPTRPSMMRGRLNIPSEDSVVGYITSIVEYEGIDTLIDGFRLLHHQDPNTHLLIVGDGPHLNRLWQYVERELIPNVIFTGRVPHEEILDYYHAIDIFVVPRRKTRVTELVTPLKPFEAFAAGCAVVLSDVRALAEIAEDAGPAARTFRADDPPSLAAVLKELLADAPLRQRMTDEGAHWVRRVRSWESNVPIYKAVYRELRESMLPLRDETS